MEDKLCFVAFVDRDDVSHYVKAIHEGLDQDADT